MWLVRKVLQFCKFFFSSFWMLGIFHLCWCWTCKFVVFCWTSEHLYRAISTSWIHIFEQQFLSNYSQEKIKWEVCCGYLLVWSFPSRFCFDYCSPPIWRCIKEYTPASGLTLVISAQWPSKIIPRYEIISEQYTQVSTIPTFPENKTFELWVNQEKKSLAS